MSRPNLGPKLIPLRKKGWTRTIFYITWTEGGRTKLDSTGIDTADPDSAQTYFRDWLQDRARKRRKGPGEPDQVWVADLIQNYVAEHSGEVASFETLTIAARPLLYFFSV